MALMIDKETKEAVPVTAFLNADRLARDVAKVNDAARGKFLSMFGIALALLRNYDPMKSPTHFKISDMMKKMDKTFGASGKNYGKVKGDRTLDDIKKRRSRSLELPVHRGHVVPGSLQLRLPPHRAMHHSVRDAGRRDQLLRVQHRRGLAQHHREDAHDRDLTKWYEEHGRHEIFAGGKKVGMAHQGHKLELNMSMSTPKPTTRWTTWALPRTPAKRRSGPRRKDQGRRRIRAHGQALSRACSRRKADRGPEFASTPSLRPSQLPCAA
jgi:hypothetical protein